ELAYVEIARRRLASVAPPLFGEAELITRSRRTAPRVSFGQLVEAQYLAVGQRVFSRDRRVAATVKADGHLLWGDTSGSIHQIAALAQNKPAFNGWEFWYCEDEAGNLVSIDALRVCYRVEQGLKPDQHDHRDSPLC
ncbi:MAG: site-specific DNA-methyltransferase, partial [Chloroflexaceae bacterium]